jgi:nucleobase transporter 1/2
MMQIQGAIMCAALFEVAFGALGIVGRLMRFIGPLCITPTITLLGMSLFKSAAAYGSKQWPVCIL